MDVLLLPLIRRWLGSAANQEAFDKAFGLPSSDGFETIVHSFDKKKRGGPSIHPYDCTPSTLIPSALMKICTSLQPWL